MYGVRIYCLFQFDTTLISLLFVVSTSTKFLQEMLLINCWHNLKLFDMFTFFWSLTTLISSTFSSTIENVVRVSPPLTVPWEIISCQPLS